MSRAVRPVFSPVLLLICVGSLYAADETLPREAVAKKAKASTVLVEVKPGPSYGSAFCVHTSGVYLTNEHVVRNGTENVSLVIDAGQKTQKVVKAKVLRRDKVLDLALLKIDEKEKLEPLALGSDKELAELTELITCGFPFGAALARQGEYPAVTINVGSVTSLRRDKQGELDRIQLDASLNPGNSGGPVLDRSGKVVGMVVGGIQGSGVNTAIPVSHLRRFLAKPELVMSLPTVKAPNRHDEFEFSVKPFSLVSPEEALALTLVVGDGSGKQREFPMKLVDGVYQARAVPFPARVGPPMCRVEVKYEDGSVAGLIEDRACRLGDFELKLSQLRTLRLGAKPEARLGDGTRVTGKVAGLDALPLKLGKQQFNAELAAALEITCQPPEDLTAVSCAIVARMGAVEVDRQCAPLYIEGLSRPSIESLADDKFVKPLRSVTPVTHLRVVSSQGDFIGQGQTYSYAADEFAVHTHSRGVRGGVNPGGWSFQFGGPGKSPLEVGEYQGAKRFPFSREAPGIEFTGNGRGCNTIAGKFVVWELEVKGDQVVRVAIDFIQRCEEKHPPLYGSLRFNSSFH